MPYPLQEETVAVGLGVSPISYPVAGVSAGIGSAMPLFYSSLVVTGLLTGTYLLYSFLENQEKTAPEREAAYMDETTEEKKAPNYLLWGGIGAVAIAGLWYLWNRDN
jgi:hypothetical protein